MAGQGGFRLGIIACALVGAAAVRLVMPPQAEDAAAPVETPAAGEAPAAAGGGFTIERSPDGHFYAEGLVNGAMVRFIVDTGASSVVLTREDAIRAGITGHSFTATGRGAGGTIRLMPATAGRLAFGTLGAEDVPVMVAESGLPVSLLGQDFLSQIGGVSIRGGRMTLH